MAGGFSSVADRSRLAIERLSERTAVRIAEVLLPAGANFPLVNGDVVRAFSAVDATLPVGRQAKRVRVEGEVVRPGEYVLPAGSSVADALRVAGGLAPGAFVFGTQFTRESVRVQQQENYERALRDLETDLTKASTTQRASTTDEAAAQAARATNTTKLIEQLRTVKPTGRIVLQLTPDSRDIPDLALEDGDRLYIPPRPTTVGVYGSVFNGGSYLYGDGRTLTSYLKLAGGPTRGADTGSTFVIRANGAVVSARQSAGWFGTGGLDDLTAEPGDTIFVPEEVNKTTFVQNAKDWTQILYQFGLGIAAIHTLK
jgi:protein involved in polysaccharide export with SLBB domain